jgi:hypothetical protein
MALVLSGWWIWFKSPAAGILPGVPHCGAGAAGSRLFKTARIMKKPYQYITRMMFYQVCSAFSSISDVC